jgi:hypothetical protein
MSFHSRTFFFFCQSEPSNLATNIAVGSKLSLHWSPKPSSPSSRPGACPEKEPLLTIFYEFTSSLSFQSRTFSSFRQSSSDAQCCARAPGERCTPCPPLLVGTLGNQPGGRACFRRRGRPSNCSQAGAQLSLTACSRCRHTILALACLPCAFRARFPLHQELFPMPFRTLR